MVDGDCLRAPGIAKFAAMDAGDKRRARALQSVRLHAARRARSFYAAARGKRLSIGLNTRVRAVFRNKFWRTKMKIGIVVFDDFTDLDLFILWDLLNRVEPADWQVKMLGDKDAHVSATGIEIKMHGRLEEANSMDAVLFCSGKGARRKLADESFLKTFQLDAERQLVGAIDSGAMLLGALGFLEGRQATTYPTAENKSKLEAFGARVVWKPFVREGNVATAAQCLSGKFLAGWVIETLAGAAARDKALASVETLDELEINL